MKKLNFINNESPLNWGVIYCNNNGNVTITESIFLNNSNTLFYGNSGLITIYNNFINHLYKINEGNIVLYSNNLIITFTLKISHFSTNECKAEILINFFNWETKKSTNRINLFFYTIFYNILYIYNIMY